MSRKATPGSFQKGDKRAGRPKGRENNATIEVRELAQGLTTGNSEYIAKLKERLKTGKAAPAVETMLWAYAHGKPKDQVELSGPDGGPVQIQTIARVIVKAGQASDAGDPQH